MRNFNQEQSLKPSTLKAAVFVLLIMLFPLEQAQSQSPPTGPAGGDLSGTYPNPGLAVDRVRKTGDTMTGTLNISMPSGAGAVSTFSLSGFGNMGPDRGVAFLFNLPTSAAGSALGAQMTAARENFALPSYLSFSTHNGTAVAESLRITGSGKVGIGTSAPGDVLHASKSQNGGTIVRVDNPDASGNAAYSGIRFYQGGTLRGQLTSINDGFTGGVGGPGALQLWNPLNASLIFGTNSSERIRIQGNGDVGIGTTAPGYRFAVERSRVVFFGEHFLADFRTGSTGVDADLLLGYRADGAAVTGALIRTANNKSLFFGTSSANTAMTILDSGNVGISNTNPTEKLDIAGNLKVTGTGNITATGTITGGTINAKYQDVAEWVESSQRLAAGTVVVLDHRKSNQVIASTEAYDTRVAGVISAQPGITLGESGETKVLVATTGRVKIKVDATNAPIQVGDLLVTGDREGFAMKSEPIKVGGRKMHMPGTLVGKALEPLEKGTGEILVLLSLQ